MSNYSMNVQGANTTATKLIDGAFEDADLRILVSLSGVTECRLGLTSGQAATGIKVGEMAVDGPLEFILPMGQDLWAQTDSGNALINLIATKV